MPLSHSVSGVRPMSRLRRTARPAAKLPPLPSEDDVLFAPGANTPPPVLAGRDDVLARLMAALDRIGEKRTAPITHHLLCGPRGCGKSVLLSRLRAAANGMDGVDVIKIPAKSLATEDGLHRVFAAAWSQTEERQAESANVGGRLEVSAGVVKVRTGGDVAQDNALTFAAKPKDLQDSLMERTDPASPNSRALLLLLDEVHAAPRPIDPNGGDLLFNLLDAVQTVCGEGLKRPVLLVAAGTPDAPHRLRKAEATFGDRLFSKQKKGRTPIFLLSEADSEQALWQPLAALGRHPPEGGKESLGGDLTGRVQALTSGHPYFIQMLGVRLHEELLKSAPDAAEIPEDAFERAAEAYKDDRNDYHAEIFGDLTDRGLGECAALVAHKMLRNGGRITMLDMKQCIIDGLAERQAQEDLREPAWVDDVLSARRALIHSGFVWGGLDGLRADEHGLGIPCLAKHAIQKAVRTLPHLAERLGHRQHSWDATRTP